MKGETKQQWLWSFEDGRAIAWSDPGDEWFFRVNGPPLGWHDGEWLYGLDGKPIGWFAAGTLYEHGTGRPLYYLA